jgi:hypothetical protein
MPFRLCFGSYEDLDGVVEANHWQNDALADTVGCVVLVGTVKSASYIAKTYC